ncbi:MULTISPECIES: hypothetical protein [Chryseobacterium]|uniref:Uncharacterized protein n=1 Tax=Chryseobacterium sediminis TaxID=1679494 RepID=A0A5B2U9B5_9FLAO|nr:MULTISPECIES: hypothetical protein [Chryseobacterium]KAA2222990.1 hypothetical protein FW780_01960 [Chryseobacterium sediminis]CAD0220424.1 protein of unknown function [Chryseobacterium sp. JV274]
MKKEENTNAVCILPDINLRIKELITEKTFGNTAAFAREISENLKKKTKGEKTISQQSVDRLFKIDKRGNIDKYPEPSKAIIDSILDTYNVSKKWLLLGELPMYNQSEKENTPTNLKTDNKAVKSDSNFDTLLSEVKELKKSLEAQKKQNEDQAKAIIEFIEKERIAVSDLILDLKNSLTQKKEKS